MNAQMTRSLIDTVLRGIPEKEVWATLEVMSSKESQHDIESARRELSRSDVKRFRNMKKALGWLRSP